jgi:exopolysaccharide biosynthesis polyprenyl glycosylphosphotransferase
MFRLFGIQISKWKFLLLGGDAVTYALSVFISLYFNPLVEPEPFSFIGAHFGAFLLMGLTYLVVFYIFNHYDYTLDFRRWSNIGQLLFSVVMGSVAIIIFFYFPTGVFVGRVQLLVQSATFAGLMLLWRLAFSAMALPQRLKQRLIIIGAGGSGRRLLEALRNRPSSGLDPVGFIDDDLGKVGTIIDGLPVLGSAGDLEEIIRERMVDLAVVAITHEKSPALINALTRIGWNGCQLQDMPSFFEFLTGKVPIDHISDLWLYLTMLHKKRLYYHHVKRLIDLGLAALGLVTTFPLLALIAIAIKLDSPGPVFFRQDRLGKDGKSFPIIKFRTMQVNAERNGPQWASPGDPRITRVGWVLRHLRLDELPQLINILRGEMSCIGPRPEREIFIKKFQEIVPRVRARRRIDDPPGKICCDYHERIPYYSHRLLVKPGLTGWAQVMFPYASSLEQTREKLEYDLYYIKNMSFYLDLAILLKTVRIALFGRGV